MMALGPSGSGKSCCIRTLMGAMGDCGAPHREMRMNPKAITAAQMFGTLDPTTNDWTDGIFSTLWRRTLRARRARCCESCAEAGQTRGSAGLYIVFEPHNIDNASPATVSRNGMVFMSESVLAGGRCSRPGPGLYRRRRGTSWRRGLDQDFTGDAEGRAGEEFTAATGLDRDFTGDAEGRAGEEVPRLLPGLDRDFTGDAEDELEKRFHSCYQSDIRLHNTLTRSDQDFTGERGRAGEEVHSYQVDKTTQQLVDQTLPETQRDELEKRFHSCYQELLEFVWTAVSPKMQVLECMYIRQTIDLLQGLLMSVEEKQVSSDHVSRLFTFALMWSLGALLELDDRAKMEDFLKVPDYVYPTDHVPDYSSILVPNVDNVRTDFLLQTISKQKKAVLLIGEQGTAKTVMIQGYLGKLDPESHLSKTLSFSSATLPVMFQRSVESYIDKRVGATYGPPAGRSMSVFIDDINMPVINDGVIRASAAVNLTTTLVITNELVRQLMEQGGFYSLERPGEFIHVVDVQLVAAMIHPGGGRNDVPQRLKRQFSVFNCTLPSNASIDRIFSALAHGYFCPERGFCAGVCALAAALVPTTRRVWQAVKAKMLPSPAKFHYIFNLRDLSRIWQGILTVQSEVCASEELLSALFHHEVSRVISDRFTDQSDRDAFSHIISQITAEDHGKSLTEHAQWNSSFVDFLREAPEATGDEPEDVELEAPKLYEPIPSLEALAERLSFFQLQFNETVRGGAMDLVFFKIHTEDINTMNDQVESDGPDLYSTVTKPEPSPDGLG
ncbi:hypothetical protein WMY93_029671 [Mugilogobius chulae]|uniref:Uncharacterized protein n=1 Tax=Mugilogobius chulae TaxID=88201 RepID=A0AAW0MVP3_9GOBI